MKIGFFGGTFDPIHLGHLFLAIQLKEVYSLDKVFFCPNNISPHKINNPPIVSSKDRLIMVGLAVQEINNFYPLDLEIKRGGVSYTIDTIKEFLEIIATPGVASKNDNVNSSNIIVKSCKSCDCGHFVNEAANKCSIYLLLGDKTLKGIESWKNFEELISLTIPVVGYSNKEGGSAGSTTLNDISILKIKEENISHVRGMEISSTYIRERLKKNLYCGHLLPAKVLEYIKEKGFYL